MRVIVNSTVRNDKSTNHRVAKRNIIGGAKRSIVSMIISVSRNSKTRRNYFPRTASTLFQTVQTLTPPRIRFPQCDPDIDGRRDKSNVLTVLKLVPAFPNPDYPPPS